MNTTKSPKEAESGGNHLLLDLHNHHNNNDKSKAASSSSSSAATAAQWLRLKDPRIVRVSRALGGKDRHSKVCTVRGLRDRRVRLSVPTAIQLYDLQDRLGLNQPSKVVDWLLNVAKNEIDELPPLQIPPGSSLSLCQYPPSLTIPNCNNINKDSNNNNHHEDEEEEEEEDGNIGSQGNNNEEDQHRHNNHHHPSFLGLLNNFPSSSSLGYNINQWEHHHHHQANNNNNNNSSGFVTNADLLLQASQILVCPPPSSSSSSSQPYFPNSQHIASIHDHMDPRQINQYHQMLMSSSTISHHQRNLLSNALSSSLYPVSMSQSVKPFSLSMMTPPNTRENQSHNKDQDFPSK